MQHHGKLHQAIVGAAGGLLGAGLMALGELLLRPYLRRACTPGFLPDSGIGFQAVYRMPEPASLTAHRVLPQPVRAPGPSFRSALVVHGSFGSLSGAAYALLPQSLILRNWFALAFGFLLWLGATECVLPLLSLSRGPVRSSYPIQAFGLAEHLMYARAVKQVQSAVLK